MIDLCTQQERALDCVSELREKASMYRQMGFKALSDFCSAQAKGAERWALLVVKTNKK